MSQAFINMWFSRRLRNAQMQARKVQRRKLRDMSNAFELHESEFHDLFRVSREMAWFICLELEEDLKPRKTFGIAVQIKVLVSIRLLAVGSYQRGTGQDYLLVLGQTTVSKFLRQFLTAFLAKFYTRWITFPSTPSSRRDVSAGFERKFGFPNVLGCIDCTHVVISTPYQNAESYKCHHGFHSFNVQLICDVNGKILNVNARYPGRVHDQFIFNNSKIKEEMMRLHNHRIGDFYLIGDSGYALEPWMMTPILNTAPGTPEDRYTKRMCQTRNIIERVNGVLKGVFRSIKKERVLNYQPIRVNQIINTCCILYNMMQHYRVPFPEPEPDDFDAANNLRVVEQNTSSVLNLARARRQHLIEELFS